MMGDQSVSWLRGDRGSIGWKSIEIDLMKSFATALRSCCG